MMCIGHDFGIPKGRFKELRKLDSIKARLPTTMICCCRKLHNILLAFKDKTLEDIFLVSVTLAQRWMMKTMITEYHTWICIELWKR